MQSIFSKYISMLLLLTSVVTAQGGPLLSGGGVADSTIIVCEEKRGEYYSSFSVAQYPDRSLVGNYTDLEHVGEGRFARLECLLGFSGEFECLEQRAGEGKLSASLVTQDGQMEVIIGRTDMTGQVYPIDKLKCEPVN